MGPDDLDSRDPVDVAEAYVQGMRSVITMLRSALDAFRTEGFADFAGLLDRVLNVAEAKIEKWAQDARLP